MLKERQGNNNNTTERQSNATQLARNSHFSKKYWLPRVGFEPTTISSPGDALTNYISYRGSSVGWVQILHTNNIASQPDEQVNSNLVKDSYILFKWFSCLSTEEVEFKNTISKHFQAKMYTFTNTRVSET